MTEMLRACETEEIKTYVNVAAVGTWVWVSEELLELEHGTQLDVTRIGYSQIGGLYADNYPEGARLRVRTRVFARIIPKPDEDDE